MSGVPYTPFFFGGDKVSTMHSDIITTLKNLYYSGDRKNYTFNKYCTAHMELHNQLNTLNKFGVLDMGEDMRGPTTLKKGSRMIPSTLSRPLSWLTAPSSSTLTPPCHFIVASSACRRMTLFPKATAIGGGRGRGRSGCGSGHGGNSRACGLVPQEEVDKVTKIEATSYPTKVYNTFTPAQKTNYWQLMNPGKTPGSGPTKSSARGPGATAYGVSISVAEFETAMSFAATAILDFTAETNKRTADKDLDLTKDS